MLVGAVRFARGIANSDHNESLVAFYFHAKERSAFILVHHFCISINKIARRPIEIDENPLDLSVLFLMNGTDSDTSSILDQICFDREPMPAIDFKSIGPC